MKRLLFFVVGFFALLSVLNAQECDFYFPTEKGKKLTIQNYDAKHKPTSRMFYRVKDVEKTPDGKKIAIEEWFETEKGELTDTFLLEFYCKGGEFYIDMKSSVADLLKNYGNMDMEVTSHDLALPSNMKAGDVLPDGEVTVVIRNNGVKLLTISSRITNRKVEGREKVTTPAGTFDCVKLTYDTDAKVGFVKSHVKTVTWYARNVGTVRSETYNKKGKLENSSELVGIE